MSDSDFNEAVDGLRQMRPIYRKPRIKVTGFLDPATGNVEPDPTSRAVTGNLYVHGYPRGANVQVLIGPDINPYVPNARVWVGENEARQAVAFAPVVDRNSVQQWGTGLTALAQPSNVPTMALIEGRLQASELGGLYVHVNSFTYDGGFWVGGTPVGGNQVDPTTYDFDVSAYVPATVGYSVWVRVYFDPSDATLHTVGGTETYTGGDVWLLTEADANAIAIPTGTIGVGAVGLTYGQTDLLGAYFVSARVFLGLAGGADFDLILTDSLGNVLSDSNGNVLTT